jgi:hypothetical protein
MGLGGGIILDLGREPACVKDVRRRQGLQEVCLGHGLFVASEVAFGTRETEFETRGV